MPAEIDELFPPSERVIYSNAPLVEVTFQVRFPSILRIEGEAPAVFQDRIRRTFPLLERGAPIGLPQNLTLPPEMMQFLGSAGVGTVYRFLTGDRKSTVTLSPESLGFSTSEYHRWEEFLSDLRVSLNALCEIYEPAFFSRIGLRYIDAIDREVIGLSGVPWSRLFRPEILGELAVPVFERNLELAGRQLQVRLPDGGGSMVLRHGIGRVAGREHPSYMIDLDFFRADRVEVSNAEPILHAFHELSGRAFRWTITDELRCALHPVPLEPTRPNELGSRTG